MLDFLLFYIITVSGVLPYVECYVGAYLWPSVKYKNASSHT
jgi:hypothetical protein